MNNFRDGIEIRDHQTHRGGVHTVILSSGGRFAMNGGYIKLDGKLFSVSEVRVFSVDPVLLGITCRRKRRPKI